MPLDIAINERTADRRLVGSLNNDDTEDDAEDDAEDDTY